MNPQRILQKNRRLQTLEVNYSAPSRNGRPENVEDFQRMITLMGGTFTARTTWFRNFYKCMFDVMGYSRLTSRGALSKARDRSVER